MCIRDSRLPTEFWQYMPIIQKSTESLTGKVNALLCDENRRFKYSMIEEDFCSTKKIMYYAINVLAPITAVI